MQRHSMYIYFILHPTGAHAEEGANPAPGQRRQICLVSNIVSKLSVSITILQLLLAINYGSSIPLLSQH